MQHTSHQNAALVWPITHNSANKGRNITKFDNKLQNISVFWLGFLAQFLSRQIYTVAWFIVRDKIITLVIIVLHLIYHIILIDWLNIKLMGDQEWHALSLDHTFYLPDVWERYCRGTGPPTKRPGDIHQTSDVQMRWKVMESTSRRSSLSDVMTNI